jgi:hypothetical protein
MGSVYAESGSAVVRTNHSNNDLNRGLRCSSSLSRSSIPRGSLAVLSEYREYESALSPSARLRCEPHSAFHPS